MNTPSNLLFRILTSASDVFRGVRPCQPLNYYYVFINEEFKKMPLEIENDEESTVYLEIKFKYVLEDNTVINPKSFKNFPDEYFIVMVCIILYITLPVWEEKINLYKKQLDQIYKDAFQLIKLKLPDVSEDDINDMVYLYDNICQYTEIVKISVYPASAMYVQSTC